MTFVEKAYAFAKERHNGQFRRDGFTPYFNHCEKVASLLDTDLEKAVAYCHDLLEDDKCDVSELNNISVQVCNIVLTYLTRKKNQRYLEDYIYNLKRGCTDNYKVAKKVKIADIVSNLSDNPSDKQVEKYSKALMVLANV